MATSTEHRTDEEVRAADLAAAEGNAIQQRAIGTERNIVNRRAIDSAQPRAETRGRYRDLDGRERIVGSGQPIPAGWRRIESADLDERTAAVADESDRTAAAAEAAGATPDAPPAALQELTAALEGAVADAEDAAEKAKTAAAEAERVLADAREQATAIIEEAKATAAAMAAPAADTAPAPAKPKAKA